MGASDETCRIRETRLLQAHHRVVSINALLNPINRIPGLLCHPRLVIWSLVHVERLTYYVPALLLLENQSCYENPFAGGEWIFIPVLITLL